MKRISLIGVAIFAAGCAPDPVVSGGSGGAGTTPDAGRSGGATGTGGATSGAGGSLGTGGATVGGSGGATNVGSGGANGTGGRVLGGGGSLGTGGAGSGGATGTGGTTAGTGGQSGHTNPLTQALIDSFVAAHNQARSGTLNPPPSPALLPVTWDPILADVAYNYLTKCLDQDMTPGLVDHNAKRMSEYATLGGGSDYVGENIYATTANTVTATQAVSDWMSEAPLFTYGPFTAGSLAAGHYTQVVWRASVRIGCAIFNCPTTVMYHDSVLCDYAPGGNITGQRPY